eukprot:652171-Amphidinium_carterae.2
MKRTRPASLAWGRLVTEVVMKAGGRELMVIPMAYYFPEHELKILVTVRGDGFNGAGTKRDNACPLPLDAIRRGWTRWTTKRKILSRTVSWSSEAFTWTADESLA